MRDLITIGLPSKGRLKDKAISFFDNSNLKILESKKERNYFAKIENNPGTNIEISIENKTVQCEEIVFSFDLDDFSQKRILEGLDKIDITLNYTDQIDSFSKSRKKWMPKLA